MRFFRNHDPDGAAVPDAADPTPISAPPADQGAHVQKLTPPDDTDTRQSRLLDMTDDRDDCPACRGTGKVQTTADYLAELVGMLPTDNAAALDAIIADFYGRLVGTSTTQGAAPHLKQFFPADLTTGDALNSKGNRQRDMLLNALVQLLTRYDPDHPESENMQALMTAADTWGRSHSEWQAADGTLYVPSEEDYLAVRNVLAAVLSDGLGTRLEGVHVGALVRAYRTVSLAMQASADRWRMQRGAPVVARRARASQ